MHLDTTIDEAVVEPRSTTAGRARIRVARGETGRSVVTEAYATSPLRLLMPRNAGAGAWVYLSSYGGGLVTGDQLTLDVVVERGATALLATQASTKVYRSATDTSSELHARVEGDGVLAVVPDPIVCFAGSRYRQRQVFEVSEDGGLAVVDCVSAGRHARGERWAFDSYVSTLQVRVAGRLRLHDATRLQQDELSIQDRMGRFDAMALVLLLGPPFRRRAEALVARHASRTVEHRLSMLTAATPIADGCLIRIAATSVERTLGAIREHLDVLPALLGDDPWARKW